MPYIFAEDIERRRLLQKLFMNLNSDALFSRLHQIHGDFILFASEEAGESWCGRPNRKCINCTHQIAGNNDDAKCADRMMTSQMALLLSKMAEMANYTWPNSKIYPL